MLPLQPRSQRQDPHHTPDALQPLPSKPDALQPLPSEPDALQPLPSERRLGLRPDESHVQGAQSL